MIFGAVCCEIILLTSCSTIIFPGVWLRILALTFPKDHPRRKELLAEQYELSYIRKLRWVCSPRFTMLALSEGLVVRWQTRRGRSERAIQSAERQVRFLLTIAVLLLPPSERARYSEEFHAELLDLSRDTRLCHALSLLRGVFVRRLRRGFKRTAGDAAVRRAKD